MLTVSPTNFLRYISIYTWVLVGVLSAMCIWMPHSSGGIVVSEMQAAMAALSYFGFGVALWAAASSLKEARLKNNATIIMLPAMIFAAIGVGFYTRTALGAVLLLVMTVLLPWLTQARTAALWLVTSWIALVLARVAADEEGLLEALVRSTMHMGISTLVLVTSYIAKQQVNAQAEHRRLKAELRASRALLEERARTDDSLRVTRELHELLWPRSESGSSKDLGSSRRKD